MGVPFLAGMVCCECAEMMVQEGGVGVTGVDCCCRCWRCGQDSQQHALNSRNFRAAEWSKVEEYLTSIVKSNPTL
jgi:hypothetical protein